MVYTTSMTRVLLYKGLVWGVVVISIFTLLSLFFVLFQAERGRDHIVGKVSELHENGIIIVDARGRTTTIVPHNGTAQGITDTDDTIRLGDFVQTFGAFSSPGVFLSEEIRIVKDPLPHKRP